MTMRTLVACLLLLACNPSRYAPPIPDGTRPIDAAVDGEGEADAAMPDLAVAAGCASGARDGDETDVDCGGSCDPCSAGQACLAHRDCATGWCAKTCTAIFAASKTAMAGVMPNAIAAADLDGDGKLDLAVANQGGNDVSALSGKGDGTFAAPRAFPCGARPTSIVAGDWNRDGKPDVAVADEGATGAASGVSILLGSGGSFGPATRITTGNMLVARALAAADLDGDGKLDLAVLHFYSPEVVLLRGKGDGAFAAGTTLSTGMQATGMVVGDLNADGKPDLAVGSNEATIHLGAGDGTFQAARRFPAGMPGMTPLALLDVDGDKKLDVAIGSTLSGGAGELGVLRGAGDGSLGKVQFLAVPKAAVAVVAGDWNGDGKDDLAMASMFVQKTVVLFGQGDGTFSQGLYDAGESPRTIAAADVNGDGKPDLLVANGGTGTVSVLVNQRP